jgi:hypothetical protein
MARLARLLLVAAIAAGALAGCGNKLSIRTQGESEGLYIDVGPLLYQVQISRYLNPSDPEDKWYLEGLPAGTKPPGAGETWFGVFMRVQNTTGQTQTPTSRFSIVDTQDTTYRPIALDAKINPFAYQAQPIIAGGVLPQADTPAASGPVQGSLLLFKLKVASLQNRPLELHIEGSGGNTGIMDLDL